MLNPASWQMWRLGFDRTSSRTLIRHAILPSPTCRLVPLNRCKPDFIARHLSCSTPQSGPSSQEGKVQPVRQAIELRKQELDNSGIQQYPRINASIKPGLTLNEFASRYKFLEKDQVDAQNGPVIVSGRIASVRKSGGRLAFVDIREEPGQQKLQILLNLSCLESLDKKTFSDHIRLIRRGDVISAAGFPCRSSSGELSLRASELTTILSPCLHTIPLTTIQGDISADNDLLDKHVEMLADPSVIETLITRSKLIRTMRRFFESRQFYEVQTPILAAAAGGATARSFETTAIEHPERKLSLRIAPELWLKRLVLGGMPRIFEIGQSFRNEGIDNTHNPEFTTCEFYATHHTLSQLQSLTEELLHEISVQVGRNTPESAPNAALEGALQGQYAEIDFIPAINAHLKKPLPNLRSSDAREEILDIFHAHSIPIPSVPTLPRLLDKLCSYFLEPACISPTWIVNTPECLSPLAKSFIHPTAANSQPVAARAELFIGQKEIVNCYEEENSPFEQRRKFIEQQMYAKSHVDSTGNDGQSPKFQDDEAMKLDEDYLQALEWGLPPTGGWGCGIDRLVMLFTGKTRINEVLAFGSLRAVTRGAGRTV